MLNAEVKVEGGRLKTEIEVKVEDRRSISSVTVYERIADARQALVRAGLTVENARLDAEVLARHALGWDRARLLSDGRDPMPADVHHRFSALIARRATREPVAFITGHREFWGLDFDVSPDVLIPRPETELIVEAVCERRADSDVRTIVDVGTGSGCLAIVLAREFEQASVLATDISPAALDMAARNASRHHVDRRVMFVLGDLLEPVKGPVDVIVSNPPYVPSGVELSPDIVRYEPPVALYSGLDGLTLVKRLVTSVRSCLADDGLFVMEFGFGQDEQVRVFAREAGWRDVTIKEDLQGIPRVAVMSKLA
jgi:release factor glutamine methyltransferase